MTRSETYRTVDSPKRTIVRSRSQRGGNLATDRLGSAHGHLEPVARPVHPGRRLRRPRAASRGAPGRPARARRRRRRPHDPLRRARLRRAADGRGAHRARLRARRRARGLQPEPARVRRRRPRCGDDGRRHHDGQSALHRRRARDPAARLRGPDRRDDPAVRRPRRRGGARGGRRGPRVRRPRGRRRAAGRGRRAGRRRPPALLERHDRAAEGRGDHAPRRRRPARAARAHAHARSRGHRPRGRSDVPLHGPDRRGRERSCSGRDGRHDDAVRIRALPPGHAGPSRDGDRDRPADRAGSRRPSRRRRLRPVRAALGRLRRGAPRRPDRGDLRAAAAVPVRAGLRHERGDGDHRRRPDAGARADRARQRR